MVPLRRIPRVDNKVLVVSRAVPIPTAGAPCVELEDAEELEELDFAEDEDALELLDGVEPPDVDSSAFCIAAVSWVLVRFNASPLAMVALPRDKLVIAVAITLISAAPAADA